MYKRFGCVHVVRQRERGCGIVFGRAFCIGMFWPAMTGAPMPWWKLSRWIFIHWPGETNWGGWQIRILWFAIAWRGNQAGKFTR
ncbi:hypothetical protein [Roseiconus lacunae]|uniref:hypothetical protein n=1 Tax=Roseiconus lacunae TaxID=2605694 RepID=UPI001E6079F1|nr:hypothetical protein [Roseiconus lacunae]MCD0460034.1 hypothetical protein [Roseiconus lacunae]